MSIITNTAMAIPLLNFPPFFSVSIYYLVFAINCIFVHAPMYHENIVTTSTPISFLSSVQSFTKCVKSGAVYAWSRSDTSSMRWGGAYTVVSTGVFLSRWQKVCRRNEWGKSDYSNYYSTIFHFWDMEFWVKRNWNVKFNSLFVWLKKYIFVEVEKVPVSP